MLTSTFQLCFIIAVSNILIDQCSSTDLSLDTWLQNHFNTSEIALSVPVSVIEVNIVRYDYRIFTVKVKTSKSVSAFSDFNNQCCSLFDLIPANWPLFAVYMLSHSIPSEMPLKYQHHMLCSDGL